MTAYVARQSKRFLFALILFAFACIPIYVLAYHCRVLEPCVKLPPPAVPAKYSAMGYYQECDYPGGYHPRCGPLKQGDAIVESQCEARGCIIGVENQTLAEEFLIADTPYFLRYQSDRVPGRLNISVEVFAHGRHFGGWSLSIHHFLDVTNRVLYMGDGHRRYVHGLVQRPGGGYLVPNQAGDQIYQFDNSGVHVSTFDIANKSSYQQIGSPLYRFRYDTKGLLTSVYHGEKHASIDRDPTGKLISIISPRPGQKETRLTIGSDGYLDSLRDPLGNMLRLVYTNNGLMVKKTDALNNSSSYTYDADGRLIRDNTALGDIRLVRHDNAHGIAGYAVDLFSRLNRKNSYAIELLPDFIQRRIISQAGHENIFRTKYDGTQTNIELSNGIKIEERWKSYTLAGADSFVLDVRSIKLPSGLTSTVKADRVVDLNNPNNPLSLTKIVDTIETNGRKTIFIHDIASGTYQIQSPMTRRIEAKLQNDGRITNITLDYGENVDIEYGLDGSSMIVRRGKGSAARTTGYTNFTHQGIRGLRITDAMGRPFGFSYDVAGRVQTMTLPGNRLTRYQYDRTGNIEILTPPQPPPFTRHHRFGYTSNGLLKFYDNPIPAGSGHDVSYDYNNDDQLTSISHRGKVTVKLIYDHASRLLRLEEPFRVLTYGYDGPSGALKSISQVGGTNLTFDYDGPLLKKTSWTGATTGSVEKAYDVNLRVEAIAVNGSNRVEFDYDKDDLLTRAGHLVLSRDSAGGQLLSTKLGGVTETWTYNEFLEPSNYRVEVQGAQFFNVQYKYNSLGHIVQKRETFRQKPQVTNYTYDEEGRLKQVIRPKLGEGSLRPDLHDASNTYTYDMNGNRLALTVFHPQGLPFTQPIKIQAVYDEADRLVSYGSDSFTYNALGQLDKQAGAAGATTYFHNSFGNLVAVELPNQKRIHYELDGKQRRIGRKINGVFTGGFLYDEARIVATTDSRNNVDKVFVYGTRSNVPDYFTQSAHTFRLISDHLGSVRFVINTSTGDVVQEMAYDEFGNIIKDTNPGLQPFGFGGGLYDKDTQLVRFGHRDYVPKIGRWTARDPLMFSSGDTNLYAYVGNDPVNFVDSNGLAMSKFSRLGKIIALSIALAKGKMGVVTDIRRNETITREIGKETARRNKKAPGAGGGSAPPPPNCVPLPLHEELQELLDIDNSGSFDGWDIMEFLNPGVTPLYWPGSPSEHRRRQYEWILNNTA